MTGRTHDLAAFTTLTLAIAYQPLPHMTLATAITAFGANMIGGLLPDIDDAGSDIWDKIRGGSLLGKIIKPLIGGHRMISHSILGMIVFGFLIEKLLLSVAHIFLVDMQVVWWSVMLGYLSHMVTDSLTKEGVPWFFPIPMRLGFPPIRSLRIRTGAIMENLLVYPGLMALNGYIIYNNYPVFREFVRSLLR
jgi:inner membrane protein